MIGYNDGCEIDKHIDVNNYKGLFAEEDPENKYICPVTGAHFDHKALIRLLEKVKIERARSEERID